MHSYHVYLKLFLNNFLFKSWGSCFIIYSSAQNTDAFQPEWDMKLHPMWLIKWGQTVRLQADCPPTKRCSFTWVKTSQVVSVKFFHHRSLNQTFYFLTGASPLSTYTTWKIHPSTLSLRLCSQATVEPQCLSYKKGPKHSFICPVTIFSNANATKQIYLRRVSLNLPVVTNPVTAHPDAHPLLCA